MTGTMTRVPARKIGAGKVSVAASRYAWDRLIPRIDAAVARVVVAPRARIWSMVHTGRRVTGDEVGGWQSAVGIVWVFSGVGFPDGSGCRFGGLVA